MAFKNVPPPQGSKPSSPYQRFIPREELGDFASWKPGAFNNQDADNAATRAGFANSAAQPLTPGAGPAPFSAGTKTPATAAAPGSPAAAHSNAAPAPAPAAAPPEPGAEEWQARIKAARQLGYQEGYRDGLVALDSFKQSYAQQVTAQVGALLAAFETQLNGLDSQMATALSNTAVQLARQVLRAELTTRPELVAKVACEAVGAVMLSARHIAVQVHPQDLALVATGAAEILQARGARLQANTDVQRGGVLVQSDVGSVDARIATRWAHAAAALGSNLPFDGSVDGSVDGPVGEPSHGPVDGLVQATPA
jgi:flagellar assembly protein FliH